MPDRTSNPNQKKAIWHTAGPAMILAGPGSGKTYVTVHRIQHLITHHGVDPAHILVITFTKAAALEMQERFFHLMEPLKPPVWFGTFHAVFYHILKQSAQYRGYTIITEFEKRKLIRNIVRMQKRFAYVKEEDYDKLIKVISAVKNMPVRFSSAELPLAEMTEEDLLFLISEYQKYLTEFKQMDFDDIMIHCEALLVQNPKLLKKWQSQFHYILIDEFQDIAPGQYRIMRLLAAPDNNIFIVGDDDQSIYRFRGASPANMQQFLKDYPEAVQILLNVNYRCHRQIVEASLAVVSENKERFEKEIEASHADGEGVCCHIFDTQEEEQADLIDRLNAQLKDKTLQQSAIICRTNYECALWAQVLEQNKIPYQLKDVPKSRFSHFIIKDLLAYMELAAGSRRRSLFLGIMNRPVRYIRRESLTTEDITEQLWKHYYRDTPAIQDAIDTLFRGLECIRGKKPYLAVRYIRNVIGYDSYLTDKYGIVQSKELLQIADEFQEFVRQFASYEEVEHYISEYEKMLSRQKDAAQGASADAKKGIELLTMHASKGLEYDSVYLPGCTEGKIPSKKAVTEADLEEERRMFYVATTRAKNNLYISAAKGKTGKDAPSRFLQAIAARFPPKPEAGHERSDYFSES
ncbi:MAG: ATP-dependent helicase [Lachnospiraceae bacterium]|nr:ATP-dependent helicase [Lachnospiraceae bacterium]